MITITMKGFKETERWINEIRTRMPTLSIEMAQEVANSLSKSMKLRAPRATGTLANSINVVPITKGFAVTVDAPYGVAQEYGFTPHVIPIEFIFQHLASPGARGQWVDNPIRFVWVSKSTPFVMPALDATAQNFPNIARRFLDRMVAKK